MIALLVGLWFVCRIVGAVILAAMDDPPTKESK